MACSCIFIPLTWKNNLIKSLYQKTLTSVKSTNLNSRQSLVHWFFTADSKRWSWYIFSHIFNFNFMWPGFLGTVSGLKACASYSYRQFNCSSLWSCGDNSCIGLWTKSSLFLSGRYNLNFTLLSHLYSCSEKFIMCSACCKKRQFEWRCSWYLLFIFHTGIVYEMRNCSNNLICDLDIGKSFNGS